MEVYAKITQEGALSSVMVSNDEINFFDIQGVLSDAKVKLVTQHEGIPILKCEIALAGVVIE